MEILRCEDVRKVYGEGEGATIALDGVSVSVEKGEFAAITGRSGCGKSTLLYIIGAVEKPTSGSVTVAGEDVVSMDADAGALYRRRKVGLIYQFYNLIPTVSVKINITAPLLLDGKKPDEEYFNAVVDALGIRDKLDCLPSQISGGQQQRAAIARSLIYRPSLLLADEPTGNLDRRNSEEIMKLLRQSNESFGQTIVMVTHDEELARRADRVITLTDGRVAV